MAAGTLIAPLLSYNPDAAGGTAYAYKRGTSRGTAVQMYDDDGVAVGTSIALNASGRVASAVFVQEEAEIVVCDSDGDEVLSFPTGISAATVTVESAALTGTLSSGSQGAGGAVALQSALAGLLSSFGTTDFKVIPTGTSTARNVKDVLASPSPLPFYDVTDTAYGAVGDDSTDDTTAIQDAIDAANTAGGGIVFLPGGKTYRISNTLTLKANVRMLGAGPSSIIKQYGGTSIHGIEVNTGGTTFSRVAVENLYITANSSATTKAAIRAGANAVGLTIKDVEISGFTGSTQFAVDLSGSSKVNAWGLKTDSRMDVGDDSFFFGCIVAGYVRFSGSRSIMVGGEIEYPTGPTAGSWNGCIGTRYTATPAGSLAANQFFIDMGIGTESGAIVLAADSTARIIQPFRKVNLAQTRDTTNPATFTPGGVGNWSFVRTNANITIANPTYSTESAVLFLTIHNNSGGAITVTYGSEYDGGDTSIAANAYLNQIYVYDATTNVWYLFSSQEV